MCLFFSGGGPSKEPKEDPNIEKVISLIKTNVQGFSNPYDSDYTMLGKSIQKGLCYLGYIHMLCRPTITQREKSYCVNIFLRLKCADIMRVYIYLMYSLYLNMAWHASETIFI